MKKSMMNVALATALLGMTAAQASEFDGLYIGGKVGLNSSDIVGATTASKENSTTLGIEEGYNWDMGGYLLGGSFFADFNQKTSRVAAAVNSGSATMGLDLKLGLPNGSWMPYAKAGWDRTTGTGAFPASQFKNTNDLHFGAGVEYKFAPNWSVVGEWTKSASKVAGSKLRNDNFTIGLSYYFGGSPVVAAPAAPAPVAAAAPAPAPAPAVKAEPKETWKTLLTDKPVTIEGANFDFNSSKIRPGAVKKLNEVVEFAAAYGNAQLEISGHTDSVGKDAYNQKLSEQRAKVVSDYLVKKGVAANRIVTKGYGETKPVADNKTAKGRAQNRRVEIRSVLKEEKKIRVFE